MSFPTLNDGLNNNEKLTPRDRSSFIPCRRERGGWTIQMATMVISDAKNMTIALRKVASKNIRE